MAGRLWKNSAGLILVHAKNCRYALAGDTTLELSGSAPKLGTLLFTSKEASKDDIEVLFVRRSVRSEFMVSNSHTDTPGIQCIDIILTSAYSLDIRYLQHEGTLLYHVASNIKCIHGSSHAKIY